MKKKNRIRFERHTYSPELNTLVMPDGRRIKVGFFDMKYNPTIDEALDYAKRKGLL